MQLCRSYSEAIKTKGWMVAALVRAGMQAVTVADVVLHVLNTCAEPQGSLQPQAAAGGAPADLIGT